MINLKGRPTKKNIEEKIMSKLSKDALLSINRLSKELGFGWHTSKNPFIS
jgi:hypothetical protein